MCRTHAERSCPNAGSSHTQPIQGRSSWTKWVGSESGESRAGWAADAARQCRKQAGNQLVGSLLDLWFDLGPVVVDVIPLDPAPGEVDRRWHSEILLLEGHGATVGLTSDTGSAHGLAQDRSELVGRAGLRIVEMDLVVAPTDAESALLGDEPVQRGDGRPLVVVRRLSLVGFWVFVGAS